MRRHDHEGAQRRLRHDESGQAMVEFALILFPLLLLVAGIIQFGIGLNFWLDQNRIANQGARWAVVNAWPGCPRTAAAGTCTAAPACDQADTNNTLQSNLRCQAISQGLRNSVCVRVTYPDDLDPATDPGDVGSPVQVRLETDFEFLPILGIGTITLRGDATMRIENNVPLHIAPDTTPCP